jgi:hypothetical protein
MMNTRSSIKGTVVPMAMGEGTEKIRLSRGGFVIVMLA